MGRTRPQLYASSVIQAIDYKTGKIRWSQRTRRGRRHSGDSDHAGKLLFTADNAGNLLAMDPANGQDALA